MEAPFGLQRLQKQLREFISQGETYLRDARSGRASPFCLQDPTYLKRVDTRSLESCGGGLLALDIGGTHTKASMAHFHPHTLPVWNVLFDTDNTNLIKRQGSELPIVTFTKNLGKTVREALTARSTLPSSIARVAVIWSNQLEARMFSDGAVEGVTGLITGIDGGSYRKDEWFTEGLTDGFDIGSLLRSSLAAHEIRPEVFLIGNDTAFTLTALPGAHGGVVASSGANCTDIAPDNSILNTEIGALYKIAPAMLSDGDLAFADHTNTRIALEDLLSGKWLPRILEHHVLLAAREPRSHLTKMAALITEKGNLLDTRDISRIIALTPLEPHLQATLKGRAGEELHTLATAITTRAGIAAAALSYFSLVNQIDAGANDLVVALDSAMARYLPGYFESLTSMFHSLLERRGVKGKITLMRPLKLKDGQEISVALTGAIVAGALWK